jgi:hypothetical protein
MAGCLGLRKLVFGSSGWAFAGEKLWLVRFVIEFSCKVFSD